MKDRYTILNALKRRKKAGMTSYECINLLGIQNFTTICSQLRAEKGVKMKWVREKVLKKDGSTSSIKRWFLV